MKNLKIKAKLLLGFTLVSVLAMIVGVVGIAGLSSTNAKHKEILVLSNAGISAMADMREYFLQQRYLIRAILLDIIQSPEKIDADVKSLREYEAKMSEAMAEYEKTILDPSDEQNYYMAKDAYLNLFSPANQKIITAAENGNFDAAMAALAGGGNAAVIITDGFNGTVDYMNFLMERDTAALERQSAQMVAIQIAVMILAVICAMILGMYNASIVGKPIKTMSEFFVRFGSTGDLDLSEDYKKNIEIQSKSRDEIGQCIAAAARMVSRLIVINETLGKIANGDLTADIDVLSEKDSLGTSVSRVLESLNTIFSKLNAASGQVSTGSEQIAQGAQVLATGSSQQAASIEEFTKALFELQNKTQRNADNSRKAQNVNSKAGTMLDESIRSMGEMLEAMNDIDESSKSITKVIKVIDDIAFQTNILALNAAVEAARAGLHGKGFAVVADEVRNLASKSADAAKETAALIEGSSEKVKEGNQIVNKTNNSLTQVAESAKEAIVLLDEVTISSAEQAKSISEINQKIEQISNVVQENSASAEESAAASEEMSSQAIMLNEIVARFKFKATDNGIGSLNAGGSLLTGNKSLTSGDDLKLKTNVISSYEKY